jgi:hypothetical protein
VTRLLDRIRLWWLLRHHLQERDLFCQEHPIACFRCLDCCGQTYIREVNGRGEWFTTCPAQAFALQTTMFRQLPKATARITAN